ncbi:hypothetical protein AKJ09_09145 [Labilithrix luteola]|uniref:Uncharacterized protein n=2 Tax=Labilithrix luteola TaxID=1391654 RepID=A0A0K1Q9Y2_9BACT|nr:hypothetical protein AKJ09_09145 [Labilithrix luteola]
MIEDMVEDHLEACAPPCEQSGPIPTGPQLVAAEALVRTRAA